MPPPAAAAAAAAAASSAAPSLRLLLLRQRLKAGIPTREYQALVSSVSNQPFCNLYRQVERFWPMPTQLQLDVGDAVLVHWATPHAAVRNLGADEVSTITEAAVEQADAATCLFEFTRTLNELASAEQKRDLLAMMWRVAMADNEISRYEEHVIRKVADLLYVPHGDFIAAKQSAM